MDAGAAARVRAWLERSAESGVHARVAETVRHALATTDGVVRRPHGTIICFRDRRRVLELDRHGTLLAALAWRDDGLLDEAAVRLPDRSWIVIEPRATTAPLPWGECDRVWHSTAPRHGQHGAEPLSVLTAVDWSRVAVIPTLATPSRLPPGAGTVVLNLIASLAEDAGSDELSYRGPYPSEQLFATLLESFTCVDEGDPLAAFVAGELGWRPAPYERFFPTSDLHVQCRARVDAVRWQGRIYHRPTWQSVVRYAPRRVRDVDERVRCSLWALGGLIEDHLELTRDGELIAVLPTGRRSDVTHTIAPAIVTGITAAIAATSAPPLSVAIQHAGGRLHLTWAPVDGDLIAIDQNMIRVSSGLRAAAVDMLADAHDRRAQLSIALALLGEMIGLLGDTVRSRAQDAVAALPDAEQAAALGQSEAASPDSARAIGEATEALLTDLARGVTAAGGHAPPGRAS